jgi:hypothetical protein
MVDFTPTDEQKNLCEMAHDFARKEIRPLAWEYGRDGTWWPVLHALAPKTMSLLGALAHGDG